MAISNMMTVQTVRPKGRLVKMGPTYRMDSAGQILQTHYEGYHKQYGVVVYTKHSTNGEVHWTFSQPWSAAGGSTR